MHAVSHSLAHRAPPATRTRVRWQPYTSIPMTTSLPSPASTYLNTPTTSTTSSSPSLPYSHEFNRPRRPLVKSVSHSIKEVSARDLSKNKFALGLVDQAVKSLCEIWRSQDIPRIFASCAKSSTSTNCATEDSSSRQQNSQQSSILSPSRKSPPTQNSTSPGIPDAEHSQSMNNLLMIKGFVHEVLRRSRTSGCVLQTALCYIEAIRPKIPELLQRQKAGEVRWKEPGLADRIDFATEVEPQQHAEESMPLESLIDTDQCVATDPMPSTKLMANSDAQGSHPAAVACQLNINGPKQSDLVSLAVELPSPLLCPRRSFLAALILASKFMQDKCYSNRAWAKLSGLSPREIGRCERALGEALEWRLWVGKLPVVSQLPTTSVHRPLYRARSESCLKTTEQSPFLIRNDFVPPPASPDRSLRRSSTLPADAFAPDQNADILSQSMLCGHDILDAPYMIPVQLPTIPTAQFEIKDDSPGSQSSTPSLVNSPSSTASSSGGDRTVQVSFQEDLYTAPTFDDRRTCIPCMGLSDQLSMVMPPPQVASKVHPPLSGLELIGPSLPALKRGGDISNMDSLCTMADRRLEEYLPYIWGEESTMTVS